MGAPIRFGFGGLRVASAFALPGLIPLEWPGDSADIRVLLETGFPPRGEHVYSWRGHYDLSLESCGDTWLMRHAHAAIRITDQARTLHCYCPDASRLPLLAEIVVRRVLPRVSAFSGRFPIHAASLSDGRGITLLMGTSGAGKSTMAAALADHLGWTIFGDDISVLSDEGGLVAYPTAPGVSVWQASQTGLNLPADGCRPLQSYDGKAWFAPNGRDLTPRPVEAAVLLSEASGRTPSTQRLSGPHVLVAMASQLVVFNPRDVSHIASLMNRLRCILDGLPVYSLSYPREFGLLPEAVNAIRRLRADARDDIAGGVP